MGNVLRATRNPMHAETLARESGKPLGPLQTRTDTLRSRTCGRRFHAMTVEKRNNPFVAEKVRQQLRILRSRGLVIFLTPGSYRIVQATESSPP